MSPVWNPRENTKKRSNNDFMISYHKRLTRKMRDFLKYDINKIL